MALAPFDDDRKAVMARGSRAERRARGNRERLTFLDPSATIARTNITVQEARDGEVHRIGDSSRSPASVDSGHRPGRQATRHCRAEHSQRRARAAFGRGRVDVRRRGCARSAVDDVARQSAKSQAGDSSRPGVPANGGTGRGRDESVGPGVPRPRDHRRLAAAAERSRPRSSGRAACTSTIATSGVPTAAASRRRSSTSCCTSSTTPVSCGRSGASIVLYLPKIQTAEEAALWSDLLDSARIDRRASAGKHQGLRARRAARGVFPADGDPRGARPSLRRLQYRPVGLHQQRGGRDGVGRDVHQSEHRRDHDDLRLHAPLRGSRAPCRQHAGSQPVSSRSGRAGWSRTFRSVRPRA